MAYNYSFVVTWTYFGVYVFIFLIVSVVCALTVHTQYVDDKNKDPDEQNTKWTAKKIVRRWAKLLWQKKKVYGQLIPHFFDQATDLGVIFEYYILRDTEEGINTMYLFIISISVLVFHRIISSAAIYHLTKKPIYILYQIFDLLMIRCIWTNYKLGSDEPSNSQRYLQILEATFESAPQILISTAFLVKATSSNAHNPIVIISLITSFWSLSARVSGDDKQMFKDEWKSIGFKAKCPCFNYRYIIRVFLWRFLEISSRIVLLCLMWINLGGLSVFIVIFVELVYLSVICFGLQSIGIMGNIIYLVAANSNKKTEQWAITMTRIFWAYRVLSSYLYLILITIFTMTKFNVDLAKVEDYETRHRQTIEDDVGFAIFLYCWIVTPIWQWVGAVIVFDFGNISSVGRDVDQLTADGKLLDVLELISFGANFNAQATLNEILRKKKKITHENIKDDIRLSLVETQIANICLDQFNEKNILRDVLFNAVYDGENMIVKYLLDKKVINVDVKDDKHRTALFYAAAQNQIDVIDILLAYEADCGQMDENDQQPMNILQYKLANIQLPYNETDNLNVIKTLVNTGDFVIDLETYNLAKEAGHTFGVLSYLNQEGNLQQDRVQMRLNKYKKQTDANATTNANKQDVTKQDDNATTNVKKRKVKRIKSVKAQWVKDRDRYDRPILDFTLAGCQYMLLVLVPLAVIAGVFGPDIAALVINSKNDCNATLMDGSEFVSFDVNDFILGGCITHLVFWVLLLCSGCIIILLLDDDDEFYEDNEGWFIVCGGGCLCCFVCWLISWTVIGFLLYSEMDKTRGANKQCADGVLSWSIFNCIQILLSPLCGYGYFILMFIFSYDES